MQLGQRYQGNKRGICLRDREVHFSDEYIELLTKALGYERFSSKQIAYLKGTDKDRESMKWYRLEGFTTIRIIRLLICNIESIKVNQIHLLSDGVDHYNIVNFYMMFIGIYDVLSSEGLIPKNRVIK